MTRHQTHQCPQTVSPHHVPLPRSCGATENPEVFCDDDEHEKRSLVGLLTSGECNFSGPAVRRFGAIHDMVHISHGPVGCGHYAQANRVYPVKRINGVDGFCQLHVTTDFQERDIVFGGDKKLDRCIDELEDMYPLAKGFAVLSECPVGLIGDDIQAVAAAQSQKTGKPVIPIRCEGFRGRSGTMRDVVAGWDIVAQRLHDVSQPGPYDVTLICFNPANVYVVRQLLEEIGLTVTAQWAGHGSIAEIARMPQTRLAIFAMLGTIRCNWGDDLNLRSAIPRQAVWFTSPAATDSALRAIAAHFDDTIRQRAEAVIAANRSRVEATQVRYRPRLAGKLFLALDAFSLRTPEPMSALGMRIGTAYRGWPDENGMWHTLPKPYRYRTLTDDAVADILRLARPDVVAGAGHEDLFLRKMGLPTFDVFNCDDAHPTWGYDGFAWLAAEMDRIVNAPWKKHMTPPWRGLDKARS